MAERPCPACGGSRLRPESLGAQDRAAAPSPTSCASPSRTPPGSSTSLALSEREAAIARRVLKEIRERLGFLMNVGLDYLTLDRPAGTLSGGEGQRIRLATQIGSSLVGVLYILDEPSIGLHQRDNRRLLDTLQAAARPRQHGARGRARRGDDPRRRLRARPGPGRRRARRPHRRARHARGDHGQSRVAHRPVPLGRAAHPGAGRPAAGQRQFITIHDPREHNLQDMARAHPARHLHLRDRRVGLGQVDARQRHPVPRAGPDALPRAGPARARTTRIEGAQHIDKVVDIDQSPIGRTPRSNPATYTGVFTFIRTLFARTPEARMRGYQPGPLLLQRQGRALRGLPGRRAREDRDALPARRLRHVRRVQGQALQPRDARGPLQGRQHRRRARHDGARGARLLRRGAGHQAEAADAATTSASATSGSASRRRRCRAARPSG